MSYTIEVSEPVYKLLNQQAETQNRNLDDILEDLLTVAPLVLPAADEAIEKEGLRHDLLKLYATGLDHQELLKLKQLLANYFADKAINEADQIWDDQNLSDELMESWLHEG